MLFLRKLTAVFTGIGLSILAFGAGGLDLDIPGDIWPAFFVWGLVIALVSFLSNYLIRWKIGQKENKFTKLQERFDTSTWPPHKPMWTSADDPHSHVAHGSQW